MKSHPRLKISFRIEGLVFQDCLSRLNFFNPRALWERESFQAGDPADVAGSFVPSSLSKTSGRPSKPCRNQHLGADIHGSNTWASMTPGRCRKDFGQKDFGLIFRSLFQSQKIQWYP